MHTKFYTHIISKPSLRATTLCLQYRPEVIACAVIEKAAKKNNMALPVADPKHKYWFHRYTAHNVSKEHLQGK